MAAVTLGTPTPARHVIGNLITRYFVVSGASGSTLATGMTDIVWVANQPFTQAGTVSLVNGITFSGSTVTLTSSAPMVTEVIQVVSLVG